MEFWIGLTEICFSGTVGDPLLTQTSPTCSYISKKNCGSGTRGSENLINLHISPWSKNIEHYQKNMNASQKVFELANELGI